jgi:hypothetical protein
MPAQDFPSARLPTQDKRTAIRKEGVFHESLLNSTSLSAVCYYSDSRPYIIYISGSI